MASLFSSFPLFFIFSSEKRAARFYIEFDHTSFSTLYASNFYTFPQILCPFCMSRTIFKLMYMVLTNGIWWKIEIAVELFCGIAIHLSVFLTRLQSMCDRLETNMTVKLKLTWQKFNAVPCHSVLTAYASLVLWGQLMNSSWVIWKKKWRKKIWQMLK